MTKCVKPLGHLATSSTKSSKWSVLIGLAGRLSTKSQQVSKWFGALCHTRPYTAERPDVKYSDIGGADVQKQEIREAVELPLTHFDLYRQAWAYSRSHLSSTQALFMASGVHVGVV